MYGIHSYHRGFLRSAEIQRLLAAIRDDYHPEERMRHMVAIERLEARGIRYSNEDFDILSAALSFLSRSEREAAAV